MWLLELRLEGKTTEDPGIHAPEKQKNKRLGISWTNREKTVFTRMSSDWFCIYAFRES